MEQEQENYLEKTSNSDEEVYYEPVSQSNKLISGKSVFILILVAVLILAAIKNPSESEARKLIKDTAMEYINKKARQSISQEDNKWEEMGSLLGMALASTLYDYVIQTDVDDYIFLSSFSATATLEGETTNLASGIILFGKLIPLKSDLEDFK